MRSVRKGEQGSTAAAAAALSSGASNSSTPSQRKKARLVEVQKALQPFLPAGAITMYVNTIAARIYENHQNHQGQYGLVIVTALNGGSYFAQDLKKQLGILGLTSFEDKYVYYTSYGHGFTSGEMNKKLTLEAADVAGKVVILVDDLIETGKTLKQIEQDCLALGATKVETAALFDKTECHRVEISPTYVGASLKGKPWLVGYGLDQEGEMRNLPFVSVLPPAAQDKYLAQKAEDDELDALYDSQGLLVVPPASTFSR